MATEKLYLSRMALPADGETAIVTAVITDDPTKPVVRLDRSWFHPQGGGQKADRGSIGPARVVHVAHAADGEVDHVVESADGVAVGDELPITLDADWRRQNMRLHLAGHLIAHVMEEKFPGLRATDGHHWPGESRVQFEPGADGELPTAEQVSEFLPGALVDAIAAALVVRVVGEPTSDRSVQVGDYPPMGCGGTHPSDTGQLGAVAISKVKIKSGKLRVSYDVTAPAEGDAR